MSEPVIAARESARIKVEKGKTYWWCACGRSKSQPFCDGSHEGTGLEPVEYTATKDVEIPFCQCKQSKRKPYCDGTHNDLP